MSTRRLNQLVTGPLLGGTHANLTGIATTVVKATPGFLYAVIVNKAIAAGVVTLYDNTAASGTKIATITMPAAVQLDQFQLVYNAWFTTGLTVVKSGLDDITIIYR